MEGIWENGCWGEFVGEKNVTGSSVVNRNRNSRKFSFVTQCLTL